MGKIRVIVMKSSDNVCMVVENIQPGSVIWAGAVQVGQNLRRCTRRTGEI